MKPHPQKAMQLLLNSIRDAIPFDLPETQICQATCHGCPKKLLEYLETEVTNWEIRLEQGEHPSMGEIDQLARSSKKIHKVLTLNKLITS